MSDYIDRMFCVERLFQCLVSLGHFCFLLLRKSCFLCKYLSQLSKKEIHYKDMDWAAAERKGRQQPYSWLADCRQPVVCLQCGKKFAVNNLHIYTISKCFTAIIGLSETTEQWGILSVLHVRKACKQNIKPFSYSLKWKMVVKYWKI